LPSSLGNAPLAKRCDGYVIELSGVDRIDPMKDHQRKQLSELL
jgi:hypothetical protein